MYRTAIYARLSSENSGKGDGKDVISGQIEQCKKYIADNPALRLEDIYVDNGTTGTVFERREFSRLMTDIVSGKINCLVVRDLSRFGRNYVEVGEYLEQVFPSLGLRFISVNEGYDSFDSEGAEDKILAIALQNVINTLYSKDISLKVKSAHRARMEAGDFKRSTLAYGYILDETRRRVMVDETVASYVRQMFLWKAEGVSVNEIVKRLKLMRAPNPRFRKVATAVIKCESEGEYDWHRQTVNNILKNRAYLGHTVLGRTERALCRGVRYRVCEEESNLLILENTHAAIVDVQTFNRVQEIFHKASESNREKMKSSEPYRLELLDLFDGKIWCADCGSRMYFKREKKSEQWRASYRCSKYVRKGGEFCTSHYIKAQDLNSKVLAAIKLQVKCVLDCERLLQLLCKDDFTKKVKSLRLRVNAARRRSGADEECAYLSAELEKALSWRTAICEAKCGRDMEGLLNPIYAATELSKGMVDSSIESVKIHDSGTIEITMLYSDVNKGGV